jgi:hypothetical protein
MSKNGFKKLLANVKMNGLSQDENGDWTIIKSSTNKKRMQGVASGRWWGALPNSKVWTPSKVMITEADLRQVWKRQDGRCYWFDIPLDMNLLFSDSLEYIPKHPLAPSVDKIDDKDDYTIDNIVICCRLANFGRNVCPADKFRDIVDVVTKKKQVHSLEDFME